MFVCFTGLGCNDVRKTKYILGYIIQKQDNLFGTWSRFAFYFITENFISSFLMHTSLLTASAPEQWLSLHSWKNLRGASKTEEHRRGTGSPT